MLHMFLAFFFAIGFVSLAAKPSPIYGGLKLIVTGGVGCMLILSQGGSFWGLMAFYLFEGMMVVFGYTTALATEQYPETWGSSILISSSLLLGMFVEILLLLGWAKHDQIEILFTYNSMGEQIIYDGESAGGVLREDPAGVAAVYSYNCWWVFVAR